MIPVNIMEKLTELQVNGNDALGILIRHAEREPIRTAQDAPLAPLTEKGRKEARVLGTILRGIPVHRIFSSPIERCIDTAQCVAEGMGKKKEIQKNSVLLKAYIDNWEIASKEIFRENPMQIIRDYLMGQTVPGMASIAKGSHKLLQFVYQNVVEGKISLFFTHDALIMPFWQHYTGAKFPRDAIVPFLGASIIRIENRKTFVDSIEVS